MVVTVLFKRSLSKALLDLIASLCLHTVLLAECPHSTFTYHTVLLAECPHSTFTYHTLILRNISSTIATTVVATITSAANSIILSNYPFRTFSTIPPSSFYTFSIVLL